MSWKKVGQRYSLTIIYKNLKLVFTLKSQIAYLDKDWLNIILYMVW